MQKVDKSRPWPSVLISCEPW